MNLHRRDCLGALLLPVLGTASATDPGIDVGGLAAPNVVPVTPSLVTCGQPTPAALDTLAARGVQAVIYLAPPTMPDTVRDEPERLASQGVAYTNIPIPFDRPELSHLDVFSAEMARLAGRRVLVHCQVNMRASTIVFLHRTTVRREPPDAAWDLVTRVWSPRGPWRALVDRVLRERGVDFTPT